MKVVVVHITDIHFTIKTDLKTRIHSLCQIIIKDSSDSNHLYFVLSGDIAFSGNKAEYERAKSFLSTIKTLLKAQYPSISIKYILVPGNHDCDFSEEKQLRKLLLQNITYQSLGDDESITDECLKVQDAFWEFYKEYQPMPKDKMLYQVVDVLGDIKISFSCINTAWVSKKSETPGMIFFPVKKYLDNKFNPSTISIGVWHHPYNWFNPNTIENNKKEFESFTEQIASTHFFGHEHEQSFYVNENKNTETSINLISGQLFNDDKTGGNYGFQTLIIDTESYIGALTAYRWNKTMYETLKSKNIDLKVSRNNLFRLKQDFLKELESIKIPLTIDNKKEIKQPEIFIFPDLDSSSNEKHFENYINSSKLLDDDYKYSILEGESQIGKTTLLSILFLRLIEKGITPVILQGKDLKEPNLDKIVKRAFRQQYIGGDNEFEVFSQLPIDKKALLIDDYQDCGFNSETTKSVFEKSIKRFGKVVVVLDSASFIIPSIRAEFHDVKFYSIKPLGYKKRNELIERYQMLKENTYTLDETTFIDKVKTSFDSVQTILGDKFMPAFPVYILSILQALEYKPIKQNETSFGYAYQSLIHYSLFKASVPNDDIDLYFNILTELAHQFIIKDREVIDRNEILAFYTSYSETYLCPPIEVVLRNLKKSKIIYEEDGNIRFGYNYILYYLSAKKIADILHTNEGRKIIETLFEKLDIEKNANILVFVTHHSKDISFIEHSLLNTMMILDKNAPITLDKNDPFYDEISHFAEELKNDILEINRTPKEMRDKMLASKDQQNIKLEKSKQQAADDGFETASEIMLPFKQAFRSIEILGQIVKNRKGSLPIPQLNQMILELYNTGFRAITYLSSLLISSRHEIIELINKETNNSEDAKNIEKRITRFMQVISFDACINIFTKIMHTAGNRELKKIFLDVANKINSPAAKLVSFGINSYYSSIALEDVRQLADEFKDNPVALKLLKGRVQAYVYNKNPDYKTKQKLASYLNMSPN